MLLSIATSIHAQPWEFTSAIDVTKVAGKDVFHHVESSGRRNIAVSKSVIAVTWEDNRDNDTPRIFLASKAHTEKNFTREITISGKGEAFEPSIIALDNDKFAVTWEEDAGIYARLVTPSGPGPILTIARDDAFQASLVWQNQQLLIAYSKKDSKYQRIWLQRLGVDGKNLIRLSDCPVDPEQAKDQQLYPTLISQQGLVIVAWEDRRPGRTIIMAAKNLQKPCSFTLPQQISSAPAARSSPYGKGHGVARVALAQFGINKVMATWADKRDFREGYDIYAAAFQPGAKTLFGVNMKVQDSFGEVAQQWHASIAGHDSGYLVTAWDDNRDGNANIMLSWLENNTWSEDIEAEVATGEGEQTHPSITLDSNGDLHMVWIDRLSIGGPTQLKYAFAKRVVN